MSDQAALKRVEEELDNLLKAATTQEQRNQIWTALFEWIHEVSDDEEWASFRKRIDEAIANRSAH